MWISYNTGNDDEVWKDANRNKKLQIANCVNSILPETTERDAHGEYKYCFPYTHNSTSGNYGGLMIMPSRIADNICDILDKGK